MTVGCLYVHYSTKTIPGGRPLPAATHPLLIIVLLFQHFVTQGAPPSRRQHSGGVQAPFVRRPQRRHGGVSVRRWVCLLAPHSEGTHNRLLFLSFNLISQPITAFLLYNSSLSFSNCIKRPSQMRPASFNKIHFFAAAYST